MSSSDDFFVAEGPAAIGFRAENLKDTAPVFRFGVKAVGRTSGVVGQAGDTAAAPNGTVAGVVGTSLEQPGVIGWSRTSDGVQGASFSGTAVLGASFHGIGVRAVSGLVGMSGSGPAAGTVGVSDEGGFGLIGSSGQGAHVGPGWMGPVEDISAIFGTSELNPGVAACSGKHIGVYGQSIEAGPLVPNTANIAGVYGSSKMVHGVVGTSNNAIRGDRLFQHLRRRVRPEQQSGVISRAFSSATSMLPAAFSAAVKNAVVPFPDGSKRVLHCMESPEHWFEDFGTAKLKRGCAVVKLDADFAKVIKASGYHVFLTPRGDCGGLYVRRQGGASFEVRELQGGTSNVAFSYRIVGRRKDIKAHKRFARIDLRLPKPPRTVAGRQKALSPAIRKLLDTLKERGPTIDPARTRERSKRRA